MNAFEIVQKWHRKFKFKKDTFTIEKLDFRLDLQEEELNELMSAVDDKNPEEIVDALIDTIWIALGTLDLLEVDFEKAFKEVARANNSKIRGIKPGREQSGGFDVIKPDGWVGPSHKNNHGILYWLFDDDLDLDML